MLLLTVRPTAIFVFRDHSDLNTAWEATHGVAGCLLKQPVELDLWALASISGSFSRAHFDHGGLSTWVRMEVGTKLWGLLKEPIDYSNETSHEAQVIELKAGTVLCVITLSF